jgi:quercetin dioxygenase-like cupin family protein
MDNFLELHNRHTGETLRIRRVRNTEGQTILTLDGTLPPGTTGPPLHVHFREREEGTVHAGSLGAQIGNQKSVLPAGSSAVFPAGAVHNWWNAGDNVLDFRGQVVPVVDLDRYLQAIFAVVNSAPSGKPSLFYIAHVAWRHRRTQALAVPPRPIQRVLFPVIVTLGHILGKYRGNDWPGSPASCPGAPEP